MTKRDLENGRKKESGKQITRGKPQLLLQRETIECNAACLLENVLSITFKTLFEETRRKHHQLSTLLLEVALPSKNEKLETNEICKL